MSWGNWAQPNYWGYPPQQHQHHHDHFDPNRPTQSAPPGKEKNKIRNKYGDRTDKEIEEMMRQQFHQEEEEKHHAIQAALDDHRRKVEEEERERQKHEDELRFRDQQKREKEIRERKEIVEKAVREEEDAKRKRKEERDRLLAEAKAEEEADKRKRKEERDRAIREFKEEEEKEKQKEKEAYERHMAKKQKEDEDKKAKEKKAHEDYVEHVQKDLAKFGMTPNQVKKMIDYDEEKEGKKSKPGKHRRHSQMGSDVGVVPVTHKNPVYPKIHRDDIEIETLKHYELKWGKAPDDKNYIIILDELSVEDTDILFDHTRKIRKDRKKKKQNNLLAGSENKNDPNYAFIRRRSSTRGEGRERSRSHVRDKSPMRERFAEAVVRRL